MRMFGAVAVASGVLQCLALTAEARSLSLSEARRVGEGGAHGRVAIAGDVALVVWEAADSGDVLGVRVRLPSLEPLDSAPLEIATGSVSQRNPDVAGSEGVFAVGWEQDGDVWTVAVDAATGDVGTASLAGTRPGAVDEHPALAASPDGFVLVWRSFRWDAPDASIAARRLDAAGVPAGEPMELDATSAAFAGADVASGADGSAILGYLYEFSARMRRGLDGSDAVSPPAVRKLEIAAGSGAAFSGGAWIEDDLDAPEAPFRLVSAEMGDALVPRVLHQGDAPLAEVRIAAFGDAAFAIASLATRDGSELRSFRLDVEEFSSVLLAGVTDSDPAVSGDHGVLAFSQEGGIHIAGLGVTDEAEPGTDRDGETAGGNSGEGSAPGAGGEPVGGCSVAAGAPSAFSGLALAPLVVGLAAFVRRRARSRG